MPHPAAIAPAGTDHTSAPPPTTTPKRPPATTMPPPATTPTGSNTLPIGPKTGTKSAYSLITV